MARELGNQSRLISGYPRLGLKPAHVKRENLIRGNHWKSNKQYNPGNVEK